MMKELQKKYRLQFPGRFMVAALLFVLHGSTLAWAHIGPPYPIMQDRKIGPLSISVWSNPDVGTGSFFIIIHSQNGTPVPPDLKVQVAVQPVSKRLPEKMYDSWREKVRNEIEFKTVVPFDKEETWHIRILLASSAISGEAATDVAVTPPGLGRWDLLLFLLPFLGIGILWLKAASIKRNKKKRVAQKVVQGKNTGVGS
jgi:hypothetical protein